MKIHNNHYNRSELKLYQPKIETKNKEHCLLELSECNETQISHKYGQEHFEKSLIIISIGIFYSSFIVYNFISKMDLINVILLLLTVSLDVSLLTIYVYFYHKFINDDFFTTLPIRYYNITDLLNILNILIKFINFVCLFVLNDSIQTIYLIVFSIKLLIDLYLFMISLKLYISCGIEEVISSSVILIWSYFKYYVLCIDPEENKDRYKRIEEDDQENSFY